MPFATNFPGVYQPNAGSSQIGDQMSFIDVGTLLTKPNGEVWLRNGQWVSPTAYPAAIQAKVPYLQATGQASAALPGNLVNNIFDIATDGLGNFVIAYGNGTNIMVSTNYGLTWSLVAHNAGGNITSVCWDAKDSLFVCAGNTTVLFLTSTATSAGVASAWTARTGSAITAGTADTARVRASSSEVVMVCGGATTGGGSRSTNGTTWSATNLSIALSTTNNANGLTSLGSGIWISILGTTTGNRSTDGGSTWSSVTLPLSAANSVFCNGILLISDSVGILYSSTTGATGSFSLIGKPLGSYQPFSSNYGSSIYFSGSVFIASVFNNLSGTGALGFYAVSPDGQNWTVKTALGRGWADGNGTTSAVMIVDANGNYVMAPSNQSLITPTVIYGNLNAVTGIGFNHSSSSSSTAGTVPPTTQYARIK